MITATLVNLSGPTASQYAARARAAGRIRSSMSRRDTALYNQRTWRPDPPRVRAQRGQSLPRIPLGPAEFEAKRLRTLEAQEKGRAMLRTIFSRSYRPGRGRRTGDSWGGRMARARQNAMARVEAARQAQERYFAEAQRRVDANIAAGRTRAGLPAISVMAPSPPPLEVIRKLPSIITPRLTADQLQVETQRIIAQDPTQEMTAARALRLEQMKLKLGIRS